MSLGPRILVADSRPDWRLFICDILRQEGYKPYPASSRQEVSQVLQTQPFDIAIINPAIGFSRFTQSTNTDLTLFEEIEEKNQRVKFIIITTLLPEEIETKISQTYPKTPIFSKKKWDKNRFISTLKATLGEGPNTDDKRLRDMLERSRYGTRPLTPPPDEGGVGRPRVLCVEVHQEWQHILIELFNTEKYFWRLVDTYEKALRILENETFHLVIIDRDSPPDNFGSEQDLLNYLVEFRPKTKVLFLTKNLSQPDTPTHYKKYPIVGSMEKRNFNPDFITAAVSASIQAPHLKIQTLGPFNIWRDGQLIGHWKDRQIETVVKLFLTRQAEGGQNVSADELVALLWPDAKVAHYKDLLPLINKARLILEPNIEPKQSSFILRSSTGYYFDIGGRVEWDLLKFRELNTHGKYLLDTHQWDKALATFEQVRRLYQHDYLIEEGQAGWVLGLRRQLSKEYSATLASLADVYAAQARYEEGIKICQETLVKDPLVESIYRRLMRFYYWQGQKQEAIKTYHHCEKLFGELFGEQPNLTTRQLYEAIINDEELVNILL